MTRWYPSGDAESAQVVLKSVRRAGQRVQVDADPLATSWLRTRCLLRRHHVGRGWESQARLIPVPFPPTSSARCPGLRLQPMADASFGLRTAHANRRNRRP